MGFTLRHLLTGETRDFSTKQLLEILGDKVNDEIQLYGEVYRISSFVATDGGDFTPPVLEWNSLTIPTANGVSSFAFSATDETTGLFLTVNGVLYEYGPTKDFHIAGGNILWHGTFALDSKDVMIVKWLKMG